MSDPTSQPLEKELESRRSAHRDLVRAYKRLFASDDGKVVLADLERLTHYANGPFAAGIGHGDLSYRCGTQQPVRFIHERLAEVLKPIGHKPERRTAKSGPAQT